MKASVSPRTTAGTIERAPTRAKPEAVTATRWARLPINRPPRTRTTDPSSGASGINIMRAACGISSSLRRALGAFSLWLPRVTAGALGRKHPGARHPAESGDQCEDPGWHGTDPEQIRDDVFRKAGDQVDDKGQDRSFCLHEEAEPREDGMSRITGEDRAAEPTTDPEGRHRPERQAG